MANPSRMYSEDEYMEILNYIMEKQEYHRLRGDVLWKEMECSGVCKAKNRSWGSMKETFRKRIYPRLILRQIKIPADQFYAINIAYERGAGPGSSRLHCKGSNKKKHPEISEEKLMAFMESDDEIQPGNADSD